MSSLQSFSPLQTNSSTGETSTSTLTYTPRAAENGQALRCRAINPQLQQGVLEDSWIMNVQCEC